MTDWPNIQGLCLVLALLALVVVGAWAAIEITLAPDLPPERDGRLDDADLAHRWESEHSRPKHH